MTIELDKKRLIEALEEATGDDITEDWKLGEDYYDWLELTEALREATGHISISRVIYIDFIQNDNDGWWTVSYTSDKLKRVIMLDTYIKAHKLNGYTLDEIVEMYNEYANEAKDLEERITLAEK